MNKPTLTKREAKLLDNALEKAIGGGYYNVIKKYRCNYCNSLFEVKDLNFDYTEAIYCINCGKDTLTAEK